MKKLKISIKLFIMTALILLCMQVSSMAATGKSTATGVRIRKEPSTDSEVLNSLGIDETVEILGKEGDWYKVTYKGQTGYASQSFISVEGENNNETNPQLNNNEPEANNTQENNEGNVQNNGSENNESTNQEENIENQNTNTPPANKVFKIAENTDISILPVITAEKIGEAKKDESVTLIINAGLWAFIKTDNISGWIRIDKLSTEEINSDNITVNTDNTDNTENNENNNNDNNKDNNNENSNTQTENNNNQGQNNEYTPKTMYSNSTATNVRSQSNTTSDVVESIGLNAEVRIVGEDNDWYKVEVNGKSGYIRKDLLSNEKTEVTSRTNEIDRTAQLNSNNETANNSVNNVEETSNKVENDTSAQTIAAESVPVSSSGVTGNDIVSYAQNYLGCRYVYGAAGPSSFDCSGFTMYVYKHFGYSLSHSSKVQATQGTAVTGDLQAGDILVFSNDGKTVGHVGIYIGNDKFIHASDSTTGVIISNLSDRWNISKYRGARRIL